MDKDCLVWRSSNLWISTIQGWTRQKSSLFWKPLPHLPPTMLQKSRWKKKTSSQKPFVQLEIYVWCRAWNFAGKGVGSTTKVLGNVRKCGTWRSVSVSKTSSHLGEKKSQQFLEPTKTQQKTGVPRLQPPGPPPTNPPTPGTHHATNIRNLVAAAYRKPWAWSRSRPRGSAQKCGKTWCFSSIKTPDPGDSKWPIGMVKWPFQGVKRPPTRG